MAEYINTPGAALHNAGLMHMLQRHRDILQVQLIGLLLILSSIGTPFYHMSNKYCLTYFHLQNFIFLSASCQCRLSLYNILSFRTTRKSSTKSKVTSLACERERIYSVQFTETLSKQLQINLKYMCLTITDAFSSPIVFLAFSSSLHQVLILTDLLNVILNPVIFMQLHCLKVFL